jgi:nucleotide-binding universal stress UspA family protein
MTTAHHSQTVLVGIDGTANCAAAVQWAAAEAARRGSRLHAVHVVKLKDRYDAGLGADSRLELAHARETVPGRVAGWVFAAAIEVDIAVSVVSGDVADQLVAEAKDASLLVVGSPDGPQHADLVSTLAARCLCPVAVVTESGEAHVVNDHSIVQPQGASHVVRT